RYDINRAGGSARGHCFRIQTDEFRTGPIGPGGRRRMSETQTAEVMGLSQSSTSVSNAFEAAAAEAKSERYVIVYLIGGMLVLTTLISNAFGLLPDLIGQIPALIGSVILAVPLFGAALGEIRKQQISSNTLASLAILAAIMSQMYAVAGSLAF